MPRLIELITNPVTNRLSTSDTAVVAAFIVSTFILIFQAIKGDLNDLIFTAYLAAWVVQNQASKQAAIKRDKECSHDDHD